MHEARRATARKRERDGPFLAPAAVPTLAVVATVPASLSTLPVPRRSMRWLTLVPTSLLGGLADTDAEADSDEYDGSMCVAPACDECCRSWPTCWCECWRWCWNCCCGWCGGWGPPAGTNSRWPNDVGGPPRDGADEGDRPVPIADDAPPRCVPGPNASGRP